jgi:hypothetical protein
MSKDLIKRSKIAQEGASGQMEQGNRMNANVVDR